MKLIKPKAELLIQRPGLEGVYKQIELAGRTCYKSEDKIMENSAKPFVDRLIKSKHLAMLEHGTVYLKMPSRGSAVRTADHNYLNYIDNKYSKTSETTDPDGFAYCYVTTNLRVLVENNWIDDLKYICEPTKYHEKRYTFRLITSIGVTRELNRHRVNSIAEESTRYCNYSKDKFGNELTFIIPTWCKTLKPGKVECSPEGITPNEYNFLRNLFQVEDTYLTLVESGLQAQQAREVLPLCLKSEIIHTAFESDWTHFFDLRLRGTTGAPHPNMKQLAELMYAELRKRKVKL